MEVYNKEWKYSVVNRVLANLIVSSNINGINQKRFHNVYSKLFGAVYKEIFQPLSSAMGIASFPG